MNAKRLLKKFRLSTILNTPFNVMPEDMDIWFQDEARFGQQTKQLGYGLKQEQDHEQ